MKTAKIIFLFVISLILATQLWGWIRILGSFWVSGNLSYDSVSQLFVSPFLIKVGLEAFFIVLFPSAVMYFVARHELSGWSVIISYIYLSCVLSIIYLLYLTGFPLLDYSYVMSQGPVFIIAGAVGGVTFYGVSQLLLFKTNKSQAVDTQRRQHLISGSATLAGTLAIVSSVIGPFRVWLHRNKYIDVNVSKLKDEQIMRVEVDKRPIWIVKRSKEIINKLRDETLLLRDPESLKSIQPENMSNTFRSIKPEYFVAYGICTHLGCAPSYRPHGVPEYDSLDIGNRPVFFCPCHAGVFDLAGRVYKRTPPPTNLKVPNHEFISDDIVRIYYPSLSDVWSNT